jgi:hypothetical protein
VVSQGLAAVAAIDAEVPMVVRITGSVSVSLILTRQVSAKLMGTFAYFC